MIFRKILTVCFGAFLSIFFLSFSFASETVLIKIDLRSAQDCQTAVESGVKAYVRLDNTFVAEIDKDKIKKLEDNRVPFQILDETP